VRSAVVQLLGLFGQVQVVGGPVIIGQPVVVTQLTVGIREF
jgi:hypothetical protein